jgi:formylglycine-generating enzyme required for sulfatase activity
LEPDIFLSYAREDEGRAGELAAALKQQGYTVFWDRQIPIGQTWHSFIGEALRSAKCVVVAWSDHSIKSDWVIEEANYGKNRRILMPVLIDIAEPPLGFGSIQAADLRDWKPGHRSQAFTDLLSGIARIMGPPSTAPPEPGPGASIRQPEERVLRTQSYGRYRSWILAGSAVLAILTGGAAYWWVQTQGRVDELSTQKATPSPVPSTPDAPSAEEFRDCGDCPLMTALRAGPFMMGSTEAERQWAINQGAPRVRVKAEKPQRLVRIAEQFAVSKYEVNFEEWDACLAGDGCSGYAPDDEDWGRGRRPVVNVSWEDAMKYVEWLSEKTGKPYRLLSEAEWEYAARAGTKTRYSWGEDITPENANYGGNVDRTTEVGSYAPNPWGLYDMHGNVWEWVEDCWNDNYEGAPVDGGAWTNGDCKRRVLRGGSWYGEPENLRSAYRFEALTVNRSRNVGFRVARTLSRSESVTP